MKRKPEQAHRVPGGLAGPWEGTELKSFWAVCRLLHIDRTNVDEMIKEHFGKDHMLDLTRPEWIDLFLAVKEFARPRRRAALEGKDPKHGRASDDQWSRIRWLQGQLGWTDEHRDSYIKQHGGIDNVAWMTVSIGRAVIVGMQKVLTWREEKEQGGSTCQN
jgi:hypothetical protein